MMQSWLCYFCGVLGVLGVLGVWVFWGEQSIVLPRACNDCSVIVGLLDGFGFNA